MGIEHYLTSKESADICALLKAVERDTWERIKFSRVTPGLRIMETTITQNIVYELRLLKERFLHTGYSLFESRNEKANGCDLLFRVRYARGKVYTYALQAKIIYHNLGDIAKKTNLDDGNYPQFRHMVSKGKPKAKAQVDLLLDYANPRGYIPMYLMYSYVKKKRWGFDKVGCTVVGAQILKDKYFDPSTKDLSDKIRYSQLHPKHVLPLSALGCFLKWLMMISF